MTIGTILRDDRPLISVDPATTVRAMARTLHANRIGAVLVLDGDALVGIVSERDIVAALDAHTAVLDCTAAQIMTAPVHSAPPATPIITAMAMMTERRVRHLPVVEDGRCIGIVSLGDLVKRRIDEAEREAAALKDYIQTA